MQHKRPTRRAMFVSAVFVAAGLALTGCGGGDSGGSAEPLDLANAEGSWTLESGKGPEGDFKPIADEPVTLEITADGSFSGTSGCNNIFGTMTIDAGSVEMGPIGQTMMACEEDAMELETKYTQALDSVDAGEVDGEELTLTGPSTEVHYKKA